MSASQKAPAAVHLYSDDNLEALLWQFRFDGVCEQLLTVTTSAGCRVRDAPASSARDHSSSAEGNTIAGTSREARVTDTSGWQLDVLPSDEAY